MSGQKKDFVVSDHPEDDMDWLETEESDSAELPELRQSSGVYQGPTDSAEEKLPQPKKKKTTLLIFMLLATAGAAGWGYLYTSGALHLPGSSSGSNEPPVVSITDNDVNADSEPLLQPQEVVITPPDLQKSPLTSQQTDNVTGSIPVTQDVSEIAPQDPLPVMPSQDLSSSGISSSDVSSSIAPSILTPMPNQSSLATTELVPLEESKPALTQDKQSALPEKTEVTDLVNLGPLPVVDVPIPAENSPAAPSQAKTEDVLLLETEKHTDMAQLKPVQASKDQPSVVNEKSQAVGEEKLENLQLDNPETASEHQPRQNVPVSAKVNQTAPALMTSSQKTVEQDDIKGSSSRGNNDQVLSTIPSQSSEISLPQQVEKHTKTTNKSDEEVSEKDNDTRQDLTQRQASKTPSKNVAKQPVGTKQKAKEAKKIAKAWKLRSAKPGSAVIFDPSTGNMKSVEVGSIIEGIGKVQSIKIENGRWIVNGTSGKISQ